MTQAPNRHSDKSMRRRRRGESRIIEELLRFYRRFACMPVALMRILLRISFSCANGRSSSHTFDANRFYYRIIRGKARRHTSAMHIVSLFASC